MRIFSIFTRYIVLLILGLGNLFIFYLIFTPLTVYPVFWLIGINSEASLLQGTSTKTCALLEDTFFSKIACMDTTIFFNDYFASIVPACIAGSAYYLLLILNLSTPMSPKTRIKSIFFLMLTFLLFNIARIFLFASLLKNNLDMFNIAHTASWYFGSTILVVLIWFANVMVFKIKEIPVYRDFKTMINYIKLQRTESARFNLRMNSIRQKVQS